MPERSLEKQPQAGFFHCQIFERHAAIVRLNEPPAQCWKYSPSTNIEGVTDSFPWPFITVTEKITDGPDLGSASANERDSDVVDPFRAVLVRNFQWLDIHDRNDIAASASLKLLIGVPIPRYTLYSNGLATPKIRVRS